MAEYDSDFDRNGLLFTKPTHYKTKKIFEKGDFKDGVGYVGVVHVHHIEPMPFGIRKALVTVWVAPCKETNLLGKEAGITDHRVLMEELELWDKFEKLKSRACNDEGKHRFGFSAKREQELFYGFTRKNNVWYSTSCTLNSWVVPISKREAKDVVRNAGIRGTDKSKGDMINLMPRKLWRTMLPILERYTPNDVVPWHAKWSLDARKGLSQEEAKQLAHEEVKRMRRLVSQCGSGSRVFDLNLMGKGIGLAGGVKALVAVLQEHRVDLRRLNLKWNHLTDEHIVILTPVISTCSELEALNFSSNKTIGVDCYVSLLKSLNSSLKELYLEEVKIGVEGLKAISNALPNTLEILDLTRCKIGDEGCRVLSAHLPRSLTTLYFNGNTFGLDGFNDMLNFMEFPSTCRVRMKCNHGFNQELYNKAICRKFNAKKDWEARCKKLCILKKTIRNELLSLVKFNLSECQNITPPTNYLLQNEAESNCSSCCYMQ